MLFSASFDSASTIPTPDHSADMYSTDVQNLPPAHITPTPQPTSSIYTSADDPFNSPAPNKVRNLFDKSFVHKLDEDVISLYEMFENQNYEFYYVNRVLGWVF